MFEEPRGHGLMLGLPVREPYAAADFVPRGLDHDIFIAATLRDKDTSA